MDGGERDSLFDLVHESIFARGLDGRIRSWNPASAELYGWPASEAIGQAADALLGDGREGDPLATVLAEDRWDGEVTRRARDGRDLVIEARWSLRRDADGAPLEIIEIGRDVTRRRAAEAALKWTEFRYRNLFQAMAASFWELDFRPVGAMLKALHGRGVTDLPRHFAANPGFVREMMRVTRIVEVNDETVKLFGGGDRAAMGDSVEPFWPEAFAHVYAASVVAAVSGAPNFASETRFRRTDGSEFDALFTACFPREGVSRGALLIGVIDISERTRAQAALQRLQADFAHASRVSMLGELTASIAHEVNQPLAAIATNGSAGLRWLGRDDVDLAVVRRLMERVVDDAQRAAGIVGRVRDMAANRSPAVGPVPLGEAVAEVEIFLRHETQAQGATVSVALPSGLPDVRADRTQLQQVLVNLIVNAMQAMSQADSLRREVSVSARAVEDGMIEVAVEDSGPGLPPDLDERLFDSFFTTRSEGLGMGLAICRSIVESHGGRIWAGAAPGGGARFTFSLLAA